MRWVCPKCRRPVSLALTECPFCRAAAAELPPRSGERSVLPQPPVTTTTDLQASTETPAVTPPSQRSLAPSAHVPTGTRVHPNIRKPTAAVGSQPRPAPAESSESPLYRGFRLGLGFALALVIVFLLVVVLLMWLTGKSWLDWF